MTGWPWLWPPQPTRRPFLQGSKGSLAFRVSRSLPPLHLKPAETVLAPKALPETLVSPAAVARYDQGKEGCLAVPLDTWVCFQDWDPPPAQRLLPPRIVAREVVGRKPQQHLPLEFPEPTPWDPGKRVPTHLPVVLTALAEEHLVCQDSHTPTLPTNPEISKPQWGLFLLFLTLGFLAACFHFPICSSALILNLRKWCPSFPRKHKAMSLSASYVARPVSGTFSGSF